MSPVLPAANATASAIPRAAVPGDLTTTTAETSQDRFLKLLVTQMRNQDPLNPMDNAQMTSQLAQISTVSGIEKLNLSMNGMAQAMAAASTLQNASLIGRSVVVASDALRFDGVGAPQIGIELAGAADTVKASIVDGAGNVVRNIALGALPQGTSTFAWDGRSDAGARVPAGAYGIRVDATAAGKAVTASTLLSARVESVSVEGARTRLNMQGLGAVDVAQIRRID